VRPEVQKTLGKAMMKSMDVDLKGSWQRIAQRLKGELGDDLFTSWFARVEPEELADGRLFVSVPTRFLRNWIEAHYASRLQEASEAELGQLDSIQIRVRTHGPIQQRPAAAPSSPPRVTPGLSTSLGSAPERGSPLEPTLRFSTFITGGSNRLAHAAAMRVADSHPGLPLSFNPLFIHSASGLGKTHLLNAVAWRIRENHPGRNVLFITAERFMYHFIGALRQRDTISFKDYFQAIDVLLIDDIQFLQGKVMTQEFYHTFASLVDAKRQIVLAADVPPAQLDSVDQRMRSRLVGGLVAVKVAELMKRDPAARISEDVIEFIANKVTGSGRELEGALHRIVAHQQFSNQPLTVDVAAMVLRDMSANPDQCRIKIDDILKVVGRHYNVARADLLSPRRARSVVVPRQVGMYLAKKLTARSLPEIGRRFGGRDHSTVLHAVRKIEDLMKSDDRLAREVGLLIRLVEQQ
jgi:chromosomal replication initiator protein